MEAHLQFVNLATRREILQTLYIICNKLPSVFITDKYTHLAILQPVQNINCEYCARHLTPTHFCLPFAPTPPIHPPPMKYNGIFSLYILLLKMCTSTPWRTHTYTGVHRHNLWPTQSSNFKQCAKAHACKPASSVCSFARGRPRCDNGKMV